MIQVMFIPIPEWIFYTVPIAFLLDILFFDITWKWIVSLFKKKR